MLNLDLYRLGLLAATARNNPQYPFVAVHPDELDALIKIARAAIVLLDEDKDMPLLSALHFSGLR
jgi:hypothetical protein